MDSILLSDRSIRTTLALKLKSSLLTAVIELLEKSTLFKREKRDKLDGTEVSNCPEAAIVSKSIDCCGLSNWARTVAIRVSLTPLPAGHVRVKVVLLPFVSEQRQGAMDDGRGQLSLGLHWIVKKGVLPTSPHVGSAPAVVEMNDLYWLLVIIHSSLPQLVAEQSNGSNKEFELISSWPVYTHR